MSPRVNTYGLPEYTYTYEQPEKVGDGWETGTLSEAGIDQKEIIAMMHAILGGHDKNLHSILLIKNGKLVLEEYFYGYNSGLTILLGGIVKNTTGLTIDKFAEQYLFAPLGISNYRWDKFPDGHIQTDGGLSLRPRDMAKIGYMIMNNGKWKDRQIVSREWVTQSTQNHIDALGIGYGYQWWIGKTKINNQTIKVLFASGHGGQKIFIIPQLDLIAVFTSRVFNSKGHSAPEGFLLKYIIPSIVPSTSPQKAITLSPEILNQFTGKYIAKAHGIVAPVFIEKDKLYTRTSFWDKVELIPKSETQFSGDSKNIGAFKIHFIKDESGKVVQCIAYLGFRGIHFDKIE
ncbi:MAG: serine hydrolase [Desulfobacterales bacterium]|jgi:hypothetical protein